VASVPGHQHTSSERGEIGLRLLRPYGVRAREQEQDSEQVMPVPSPPLEVPRWQVSTQATPTCFPLAKQKPLDQIMKRQEQEQGR
jgi:hypothetical protein